MLSHIVATAENGVIGKGGGMPWHIPEDFKFFKRTTMGHAMIMGRRTYESIGKALPGRLSVVVTRDAGFRAEGVVSMPSLDAAVRYCEERADQWGDEIFIIGGGEIFEQSMALVDRIYLTKVHARVEDGDTFYPAIDDAAFEAVELGAGEAPIGYTILRLDRKRPITSPSA